MTSRIDTMPTRRSPSTTGMWRYPCSARLANAAVASTSGATQSGSAVIHAATVSPPGLGGAGREADEIAFGEDSGGALAVDDDHRSHTLLTHTGRRGGDGLVGGGRDHRGAHDFGNQHCALLPLPLCSPPRCKRTERTQPPGGLRHDDPMVDGSHQRVRDCGGLRAARAATGRAVSPRRRRRRCRSSPSSAAWPSARARPHARSRR